MKLSEAFGSRIRIADGAADWKEAVRMAVEPLIQEGYAQERYVTAIYENVKRNGNYFILAPGFALPHARPEEGGLKTGLSFLKLKHPVKFPGDEDIWIFVGFASSGSSEHMDMLGELADILTEEDRLEKLFQAESAEAVKEIFS